jgi:putative ABC transport system permease protein
LGQRSAHRPLAAWFWADSRQQLSGLSLALMALLLALAVNVGVGTMVESFSRTFISWLDGRLMADVYLNAADNTQAAEIRAWLQQRPEVEAILPSGRAETQIGARRLKYSVLPITPPTGIAGRCFRQAQTPGAASALATRALSANNWRGV